jgi:cytochrome c oxidase subunit II
MTAAAGLGLGAAACSEAQSALRPAGSDAQAISDLFWIMVAGGAVIWLAVMGFVLYGVLVPRASERLGERIILFGGVILPAIVLGGLLVYGLGLLPDWRREDTALRLTVTGEQWWWRVSYEDASLDMPVEAANEIHLPAGEPVTFVLETADVIHSFWIPALGGKMDMLPGRTNLLRLTPTQPGIYRGVCAEFCGPSHALMAFDVVVHERPEFEAWLAREAQPASASNAPGARIFESTGCAACHTVRGQSELGGIGPDLTHVGSRRTLAAGTLVNQRDEVRRWLQAPDAIKPGVQMPAFAMLADSELDALADYLVGLQ